MLDTRVTGPVPPTGIDIDLEFGLAPADAAAAIVNIAAVDPATAGWAVVYACGRGDHPFVSNINYSPMTTVSNRAVVSLDLGRRLCVYSSTKVHLVIDVEGWVTSTRT